MEIRNKEICLLYTALLCYFEVVSGNCILLYKLDSNVQRAVWFGDGYGYGDCIVRIRCCFVQGLEATEDIITHQPLIEYIGNVMLRDQFYNGETPFERYVMYVSSPYMEKKYPPQAVYDRNGQI